MNQRKTVKQEFDHDQTLQKVAETLTEKPITIIIDIKPKNKLHTWLIKHKIKPSKRVFEVKPQRVGNIFRISGRAVKLSVDGLIENTDRIGTLMDLMSKHGNDIFYIVAASIQNDHREPSKKIIDIVKNEFEMDDLLKVLQVTIGNYNIPAFLTSIALITGINALSVKPNQASPQVKGS